MQVRVPRLAWALLLWPLALSGCSGPGGPPSDPYAWTCQDWMNAGLIQKGNLSTGKIPFRGTPAGDAFTTLGNDLHAGHPSPWGDANGKKVSTLGESGEILYQIARICNGGPGTRGSNAPASLAVVYARRYLNGQEQKSFQNSQPPP